MKAMRLKAFKRSGIGWVVVMLAALVLSACNSQPTLAPEPTATPLPEYRLDTDKQLYFTISVPAMWNKNTIDQNSVAYNATAPNTGITISTRTFQRLAVDNKELLEAKIQERTSKYNQVKRSDAGQVSFVDGTANLTELRYNNGADVVEYLAQVNLINVSRGYLLQGLTPLANAETNRQVFLRSFGSMTFSPPDAPLPVSGGVSGATDPTVVAAEQGGQVLPTQGKNEIPYRRITLTEWTTPPLDRNRVKGYALTGQFPSRWLWRLKDFPRLGNFGISLTSNRPAALASSSSDATLQIGIIPDAFTTDNPTADDWNKVGTPILEYINANQLTVQGTQVSITPLSPYTGNTTPTAAPANAANTPSPSANATRTPGSPAPSPTRGPTVTATPTIAALPTNLGNLQRSVFIVRSSSFETLSRGSIYMRSDGKNLIVAMILLSQGASLSDETVRDYNDDTVRVISSLKLTIKNNS